MSDILSDEDRITSLSAKGEKGNEKQMHLCEILSERQKKNNLHFHWAEVKSWISRYGW